jgi:integrase
MSGRGHVARKQTSRGPRYYPVVELPRDPVTGKRRQRWHPGHTSRKAAGRELTRILASLDSSAYVAPSEQTVRDFLLNDFLPGMRGKLEPNTHDVWADYVRAYVVPRIGEIRLQDLGAAHLRCLYADLAEHGRRRDGKGLAPATVRYVHAIVHRALADAVELGYVVRNVASLKAARPAAVPKVERRVWTPEQLRAFLQAMASHRLAVLWHLDATTGLRRSELLGLPWAAVDLDAAELAVVQRLVRIDRQWQIRRGTKTPKSARRIALDPATVTLLRAHRAHQLEERLAWGPAWQDNGLMFCREDGSLLRPDTVTTAFKALAAAAGLPELTLHGLRHSYATAGLAAGVPVKVMSERLGHATTAITSDLYQHVLPAMDAAAAVTVADLILGDSSAG